LRIAGPQSNKSARLRIERLLDRTPIDAVQLAKSERVRRARVIVLAAVSIIAILTLSTLALPLLDKASEAPKKAFASYSPHSTIMIAADTDFTPTNGVTGGNGTSTNPYVINGWEIDASIMGGGIMIMGTSVYYQLSNLHIFGLGTTGIMLFSAPHGTVNDSLIENSDSAIFVITSDDMSINNNTVLSQSFMGIAVSGCSMVEVRGNTLDQIETSGIIVMESNNVDVHDNMITNVNGLALAVQLVDNIMIAGNNASTSTFCGLYVNDTRGAAIQNNDLTMNGRFGLYIGNVSNANVFHNRFIGNPEQALQGPNTTSLAWDDGYPSGGNYWSDYGGTDGDGDGIGDTPYAVAGGGTDRYPFVNEDMKFVPEFGAIVMPIIGMTAIVVFIRRRRKTRTD
jgi:parallel beta-helix repeat protein